MGSDSDKISRFLRNALVIESREGPCFRLTLKHIVPKGPGGDVANYNIGDAQEIDPTFLEELQGRIETDASVDAEGNGGVQKYQLLSYHTKDPDKSQARLVIRAGDASNEEHDFDSEPANERGLLAQQMRHNEALIRSQVTSTNNVMNILTRANEKLQQEKQQLEEDRYRNLGIMEQMMQDRHGRYLAEQQADFDMAMKKETFSKLAMLMPAVVNKLAGQNVLPEATNPKAMAMKGLANSIMNTPGKLEKIMGSGIFSPEELTVLATLLDDSADAPQEQKSP
jgi:hypothetical protein